MMFENLKYTGKNLRREGKTKNGDDYKIYKLNFENGKNFIYDMDCFDNIGKKEGSKSLTLEKLEKNTIYNVGYEKNSYGKKVIFISETKDETIETKHETKNNGFIPLSIEEISIWIGLIIKTFKEKNRKITFGNVLIRLQDEMAFKNQVIYYSQKDWKMLKEQIVILVKGENE